jgi:hypothetical protein
VAHRLRITDLENYNPHLGLNLLVSQDKYWESSVATAFQRIDVCYHNLIRRCLIFAVDKVVHKTGMCTCGDIVSTATHSATRMWLDEVPNHQAMNAHRKRGWTVPSVLIVDIRFGVGDQLHTSVTNSRGKNLRGSLGTRTVDGNQRHTSCGALGNIRGLGSNDKKRKEGDPGFLTWRTRCKLL